MARVASIVANGGDFAPTQFILKGNNSVERPDYQTIPIVSNDEANVLKRFMIRESDKHRNNRHTFPQGLEMGGKTGTPERDLYYKTTNRAGKEITAIDRKNDGWYIFFINSAKENAPLAVAMRMERLPGKSGSGAAVRLTDKVVLKSLRELGYL
jgi:cell division protein FtsI/penicillin-binding protein 2